MSKSELAEFSIRLSERPLSFADLRRRRDSALPDAFPISPSLLRTSNIDGDSQAKEGVLLEKAQGLLWAQTSKQPNNASFHGLAVSIMQ